MPKKTKKEKIIAEYRKRLRLLQSNQVQEMVTPNTPLITSPKLSMSMPIKEQKVIDTKEDALITSYFKKDSKKSLFLIAIVITLEFSLYFATINNYLKLGH